MVLFSPKRGRILSAKSGEGALRDVLDLAEAGDLAILGRAGVARCSPASVVIDQRPRLLAIHQEAMLHRLLAIIVALDQRLAGRVILALDTRRIEFHVVAATRGRMHAPAAHALDDLAVR